MKVFARLFTVILLAMGLVACGPSKVAIKPDAVKDVHSVALIRVTEPAGYVASDFGNIGMAFGAIGGAIAGASSANAGKNVNQIASERGLAAGEILTELLVKGLKVNGYDVELIDVEREKPMGLLESYSTVKTESSDAVLDVVIESIGYATEHPIFSAHWRPATQIQVALVDIESGRQLYAEKFMYGYHNPFMSGTDLDAPEKYHFDNNEALFADADLLVEGIRHSIEMVSEHISVNLSK